MKYHPPVGGAEGDAYINEDPTNGTEGSPIPAAAIEDPQREIMNVINGAGITPDANNKAQLLEAINTIASTASAGYEKLVKRSTSSLAFDFSTSVAGTLHEALAIDYAANNATNERRIKVDGFARVSDPDTSGQLALFLQYKNNGTWETIRTGWLQGHNITRATIYMDVTHTADDATPEYRLAGQVTVSGSESFSIYSGTKITVEEYA